LGHTFFAKLKNFFAKLIFSRQNFFWYFGKGKSFPPKKIGGKKSTWQKSFLTWQNGFAASGGQ
jgi:hypothetical protein